MTPSNEPQQILIIEDELPFQEIYRDIFEAKGFRVTIADSGEEALATLKTLTPDLVLLDVILPGLSGLDILEFIRQNDSTKTTPVLVYSVINEQDQIERALKLGASDYTIKGQTPAVEVLQKAIALLQGPVGDDPRDAY